MNLTVAAANRRGGATSVKEDLAQEQEWIGQNNLMYAGLIGIGVVMVQPFLTAASLDLLAMISLVGVGRWLLAHPVDRRCGGSLGRSLARGTGSGTYAPARRACSVIRVDLPRLGGDITQVANHL
jgi:hypothetical protein